jgi:hypothetical protein
MRFRLNGQGGERPHGALVVGLAEGHAEGTLSLHGTEPFLRKGVLRLFLLE